MRINKINLKNIFLVLFVGIVSLSSLLEIFNNRKKIINKVQLNEKYSSKNNGLKESNSDIYSEEKMDLSMEWSKKILKGNYILFFRHRKRKWTDVQMYDALESDLHKNGPNGSRFAERHLFS